LHTCGIVDWPSLSVQPPLASLGVRPAPPFSFGSFRHVPGLRPLKYCILVESLIGRPYRSSLLSLRSGSGPRLQIPAELFGLGRRVPRHPRRHSRAFRIVDWPSLSEQPPLAMLGVRPAPPFSFGSFRPVPGLRPLKYCILVIGSAFEGYYVQWRF